MLLTGRALIFLAFGAPAVYFFAPFVPPSDFLLSYNLLFLALVLADLLCTPTLRFLRVLRAVPDRFSLGTANTVTLIVENLTDRAIRAEMKDEPPRSFHAHDPVVLVTAAAHASGEGSYHVTPPEKGEYPFGNVNVRVHGPLGLVKRQIVVKASGKALVYPNVREIGKYELMARRGRLMEIGMKPMRVMGIGTDFESLREYEPDDDFRRINWKATARKGKLISSQYEMERSQNVLIMIDGGRLMSSRIEGILKVDYAVNAALMLSYVAMKNDDRVGLLTFSREVIDFLPPGRGRRQMNLILESLRQLEPVIEEPDYGRAVRYLTLRSRKRSLVIVFTDLIDESSSKALVKYLSGLYPAHLPLCVTMQDPYLTASASQPCVELSSAYERAVAGDLLRQRSAALGALARRGVQVMDVPPGKLTGELVSRYLEIKLKGKI